MLGAGGIGPEVTLRAVDSFCAQGQEVSLYFVGPDEARSWTELPDRLEDLIGTRDQSDAEAGHVAARSIERAAAMALDGTVHAIVTAPVHKPSLHAAGREVPGVTELLQRLSGAPEVGMLMASERTRLDAPLRVLLATTHISLREVPDALTAEVLTEKTILLDHSLRADWGIPQPRLALCALNPHASDGGLFGDEEARIFSPALESIRTAGVSAAGPLPADTVFQRALAGEFDAVVAPYHDVGMAAFKTISFGTGVNVTLGLPFIRTSPDHGTAFDIAGTGQADPTSMLEALRLAVRLTRGRFDMVPADV